MLRRPLTRRWMSAFCLLGMLGMLSTATPADTTTPAAKELAWPRELASTLLARHASEVHHLVGSPFRRPIALTSAAHHGAAYGEAIAELDVAMPVLLAVLTQPQRWCEIVLLTPAVAGCGSSDGGIHSRFEVSWVYRFDQAPDTARNTIRFGFRRIVSDPRYLAVQLRAEQGPLGTHDYQLDVEATPLDASRSVLRVRYAYRYGIRAAMAFGTHLATGGRNKIGFGVDADGQPLRGLRGSVERNVMRYFLAIEAHALQTDADPVQRFTASLDRWLEAVDHYPAQIAEPDRAAYRAIKLQRFGALP